MAEYIERDKILGYMNLVVIHARGVAGNDSIIKKVVDIVANMRDLVAMAPAADVAPVRHGRWVCIGNKPHLIYGCSECGDQWGYGSMLHMKYCPHCGARMDGDGNG